MKKFDKRGVSALIATVLIIGITIAAFGLVYSFIIPLIREGISTSQACADAQITIVTEKGYTCDNNTAVPKKLNVQVSRGPKNTTMSGIQVIYSESGNSYINKIDVKQSGNELRPNSEKVYILDYTASGFSKIDFSAVAAVIELGNSEHICNPSPEVSVEPCA